MNHLTALAIAKGIQQDRLDAAERSRQRPATVPRPSRPSHFGDMARALLRGFRRLPQPSH